MKNLKTGFIFAEDATHGVSLPSKTKGFTLAEGATHVVSLPTKAKGFTLAEVLITLGIIGVVAAMTIPTLISNSRGQKYRAQFKKTLSSLNQGVRLSQAQYDIDFANTNIVECYFDQNLKTIYSNMQGHWKGDEAEIIPQVSVAKFLGGVYDFSSMGCIFELADASSVIFNNGGGYYGETSGGPCTMESPCYGWIDVDGENSGPNEETQCSAGTNPCVVNNSDIKDVFQIKYYDMTVEPATDAGKYVLQTAK